jgi:hypothetical protein
MRVVDGAAARFLGPGWTAECSARVENNSTRCLYVGSLLLQPDLGLIEASRSTVTAAFDPRLNGQPTYSLLSSAFLNWIRADKPGAYLDDCVVANEKIAPHSSDPVSTSPYSEMSSLFIATEQANAEKLWDLTEKIIGEKFTF